MNFRESVTDIVGLAGTQIVRVGLETSLGSIMLSICVDNAPASSNAFLANVDDGTFAENGGFYRVVRAKENDHGNPGIDVVQGGLLDESQARVGIPHETTSRTGLRHIDGTVSLARSAVGTATGAAFFICIGEQSALDEGGLRNGDGRGYAAFGRVVSGMEIVRMIHRLRASAHTANPFRRGQMLETPIRFLKAWRNDGESR